MRHIHVLTSAPAKGQDASIANLVALFQAVLTFLVPFLRDKQLSGE